MILRSILNGFLRRRSGANAWTVVMPTFMLVASACKTPHPDPVASIDAAPSVAQSASGVAPVATAAGTNDGTDPKAPVLSPDDAAFKDPRRGFGWSDRCFTEIRAGKLGWARAACDRALALPDLDPKARPPLLYNEGMIAKKSGDTASARAYFTQSLALRGAEDPGRSEVEKELVSVGGAPTAPKAAVLGDLECRTRSGARTIEVFADKFPGGNEGTGTIRFSSGASVTVQVVDMMTRRGMLNLYVAHSYFNGKPVPVATVLCASEEALNSGSPFGDGCGAAGKQLLLIEPSGGLKPALTCE